MTVNTNIIQYIAIFGSASLLIFILYLVRGKKISEQYSVIWIILSLVFIGFSIWRDGLNYLSFTIGIAYPPMAFLLILVMAIFLILIQFSIILTKLSKQSKKLAQKLTLLNSTDKEKI
jgi:hypothetical protein